MMEKCTHLKSLEHSRGLITVLDAFHAKFIACKGSKSYLRMTTLGCRHGALEAYSGHHQCWAPLANPMPSHV